MPVVPQTQIANTTTNVTRGPRATGDDFAPAAKTLQQVGQNLGVASDNLNAITIDMQIRENSDRVLQAEVALKDAERAFLSEMNNRKGADAFGVTEDAEKWWQENAQKIGGTLKNEMQRQMFDEIAQSRRQLSLNSVSGYEAGERRNSFNNSAKALIETSIAAASEAAFNPSAIEFEKARILETIGDLADSNGWTPEIVKAESEAAMTAMHGAVVTSLMAKTPLAAQEYFKNNRDEISGKARAAMEVQIEAAVVDEKGFNKANAIFDDESSFDEAVKEVRKIKDKDLQKATRDHLRLMYADEVAARQENERTASDDAWKIMASGRNISNIPPTIWANLAGTEQIRLQQFEQARAAAQIKPVTVDNVDVLSELQRGIEDRTITSLDEMRQYQPFLKPGTFETQRQAMLKAGEVPQDDILRAYESRIEKKRDSGTDRWGDDEREEFLLIQEYVNKHVKEGGRVEDIDALVDKWFLDGYGLNDKVLRNDPNTLGESFREGRTDFVIRTPDVDQRMMQDAVSMMQSFGVQFDPETGVDEFYTQIGYDARRYFVANGIETTAESLTAFAILKAQNMPITERNIETLLGQLSAN